MKNYLVPISVRPNSLIEDQITVGMFAFNGVDSFYDYSADKLKLVNAFLDDNTKEYLETALEGFKNSLLAPSDHSKLAFESSLLSENYLSYLSKYSKGLIKFGEPKGFAMILNEDNFYKAFRHFVGADAMKSIKAVKTFRREFKSLLKDEVFNSIDVDYMINPEIAPEIYAPHKVDFIGVNGSPIMGIGIDFNKTPDEVDKSILTFRMMVRGIKFRAKVFKKGEGIYEAYFNDPESKKNKELLDKIRKDSDRGFELVEIHKFDRAINKIKNGNYGKFSESELVL